MLSSQVTPTDKRRALRAALDRARTEARVLRFPGAFNPLSARLIQDKGFEGAYVSGAVLSADLALPDIGLTTQTEVAGRSRQIARATDLPVIVDADTGFGEPMNVARTVQEFEDAGVAGCHIEDQVNPKRCGHLDGKAVVEPGEAVKRIRAAASGRRDPAFMVIARTDVRATMPGPDGVAATVERARAYVDAGADMVFPEAMRTLAEFEAVAGAVDVPVLANMTEFGKSDLFTVQQLADAGVALVIYPVTLLRLAMGAAERGLDEIAAAGTQAGLVAQMQSRARLYELVDYEAYNAFDSEIFTYRP